MLTDNATADEIMSAAMASLLGSRDELSMLMTCSLAPTDTGGLELHAPGGAVYKAVSRADSAVVHAVAAAAAARGIPPSKVTVLAF
jgi:hypothetical protein